MARSIVRVALITLILAGSLFGAQASAVSHKIHSLVDSTQVEEQKSLQIAARPGRSVNRASHHLNRAVRSRNIAPKGKAHKAPGKVSKSKPIHQSGTSKKRPTMAKPSKGKASKTAKGKSRKPKTGVSATSNKKSGVKAPKSTKKQSGKSKKPVLSTKSTAAQSKPHKQPQKQPQKQQQAKTKPKNGYMGNMTHRSDSKSSGKKDSKGSSNDVTKSTQRALGHLRIGHPVPLSKMTKAQRRAFQHSYSRHGAELGLPKWSQKNAEALRQKFNKVVGHIRETGTYQGIRMKPFNGKSARVNYYESNLHGSKYYYYETMSGQFVSAGKAR